MSMQYSFDNAVIILLFTVACNKMRIINNIVTAVCYARIIRRTNYQFTNKKQCNIFPLPLTILGN